MAVTMNDGDSCRVQRIALKWPQFHPSTSSRIYARYTAPPWHLGTIQIVSKGQGSSNPQKSLYGQLRTIGNET